MACAAHVWQLTCTVITIWWREGLTCGMCSSCVAINVHSNYYMVEGSPHVWHVQLTRGINVHGNYYYMVEGSPHVWRSTCMVITTIWWRGALTYGSCVVINMHSNYYMVEGSPHMWHMQLTCGN